MTCVGCPFWKKMLVYYHTSIRNKLICAIFYVIFVNNVTEIQLASCISDMHAEL